MLPPELARQMREIAAQRGAAGGSWTGLDDFLPFLERMREDGAVVVVKLDGQRTGPDDAAPYTVVVSGGGLDEDFVTITATSALEAVARATVEYAGRAWPAR